METQWLKKCSYETKINDYNIIICYKNIRNLHLKWDNNSTIAFQTTFMMWGPAEGQAHSQGD